MKTWPDFWWNWAHGGAVSDNGTLFVFHAQLGLWIYKTS